MSFQEAERGPPRFGFPTLQRIATIAAPYVLMATLWQIGSLFFPHYLFPSLIAVFWRCMDILRDWSQLGDVLATVSRILAGLAGAFLVGAALALVMNRSSAADRFLAPILSFFQGIP